MHSSTRVNVRGRSFLRPSGEADHGLFGAARLFVNEHRLVADCLLAGVLLTLSMVWLIDSPFAGLRSGLVQAALVVPLVWRRSHPTAVFVLIALFAFFEWVFGPPLIGAGALLVALYTVAVHEPRPRSIEAAVVLEIGAILAATRWHPAETVPRSLLFLTATVVAALFAGLTVRSGSEYMAWLSERAARLEIERDQQASIAAAEERTRIAREMHDIVAHSLSVVITLVDAASLVNRSDPDRANDAMHHASAVGRQALGDMRTMIGVLRTDGVGTGLVPQPGLAQLDHLFERIRATGLVVETGVTGETFDLGPGAELSIYRIIQESLTNTLKHASASTVRIGVHYDRPVVTIRVADDGKAGRIGNGRAGSAGTGHGIDGMRNAWRCIGAPSR